MKDFIEEVRFKQSELGYTDREVSELTGIPLYIYYDLKKYRTYLTRVAYFSLCCVLGIEVVSHDDIDVILEQNKSKVGVPDTNLRLAAQVANPEYVMKLEKEVVALQGLKDRVDSLQDLILVLKREKEELEEKLSEKEVDVQEIEKECYQRVSRELSDKFQRSLSNSIELEYREKIEELEDKISKRDIEIRKYENLYYNFYMSMYRDKGEKIEGYPIPKLVTSEELRELNS